MIMYKNATQTIIKLSALCRRDILLAWRGTGAGLAIGFFFIAIMFLPFGIGADLHFLRALATGFIWVALMLAVLLSLEQMFQSDIEDGSFDQLLLGGVALEWVIIAKALAHWLGVILPLIVIAPLAGLLLNISPQALIFMLLVLLAGSPALSFLGIMGAALAAGIARSGLLAALLVMPLYVPILIFGNTGLARALNGQTFAYEIVILLLLGVASMCLSPLAPAAALRSRLK